MAISSKEKAEATLSIARVVEALEALVHCDEQTLAEALESVKHAWRREVLEVYREVPTMLEKKLGEGDEAFSQIHRISKMLSVPIQSESNPIKDWINEARRLFREKNFRDAYRAFEEASREMTPSIDDIVLGGTCAVQCGELETAEVLAEKALEKSPTHLKALLLKGLVYFSRQEFEKAEPVFKEACESHPESETAIRYLKMSEEELSKALEKRGKKNIVFNQSTDPSARRRWIRKSVSMPMLVTDHNTMCATSLNVSSISAGGALVKSQILPDEFNFCLELPREQRVYGVAQKIYRNSETEYGIKFQGLSPDDEDLINRCISH